MPATTLLQPGDVLLYKPSGFYGKLIAEKTWHPIAHCEGFFGYEYRPLAARDPKIDEHWTLETKIARSVASRDGKGVAMYPTRYADLHSIYRPVQPFNRDTAMAWFIQVDGQGYDWFGLLRFVYTGYKGTGDNGKQFCSEFLTRWLRHGGIDPFNGEDADAIAPFQFALTPALRLVWSADQEQKAA